MKRYNFYPVNHQPGNRIEAENGEYVAAEDALRLQSELTKARELLTKGRSLVRGSEYKVNGGIAWLYGVENFLAHQSAPVAQALSMENQRVVPPEPPIAGPHPLEVSMGPGARSGSVQSAPAAKGEGDE